MKITQASFLLSFLLCCFLVFQPKLVLADQTGTQFTDDMWSELYKSFWESPPKNFPADTEFKIDPSPANDSEQTRAEIQQLKDYEKNSRTSDTIALIQREAKGESNLEFGLGAPVSPEMQAMIDELRLETLTDYAYISYREKRHFKRARPTQLAPEMTTVIEVPPHASYPSGHAGEFMIMALLYSYIDPAREADYKALANDVGVRREVAGVHYHSDTLAGQGLAQEVFNKLLSVPAYEEKLDRAKDFYEMEKSK